MAQLRKIVLCCIVLISSLQLRAQEILYSPYEDYDLRSGTYAVIGKVGELNYVYRGSSQGYYLDAYNDSMQKTATVVLDFINGKVYSTKFIAYQDKIVFLYQSVDGARVTLFGVLLDERGRMIKRPVRLGETKLRLFGSLRDYFGIAVSENRKHIAVYELDDRATKFDASCTWLTDSMTIAGKAHTSFVAENEIREGDAVIDNDGKLYLPVYTPIGSREYADQVWLLTMSKGDKKFTSHELPLNALYASGIYMKMDTATSRISIGGFYSDKKNGNYEGVLIGYFDIAADAFIAPKYVAFDDDLRAFAGGRKSKRTFDDYKMRHLIIKNDGGFVMIAEDYFVTSRNYSQGWGYSFYYPTMSSTVREYHYGDIMALSYDADGHGQWRSFIRKEQVSQEDDGQFSSYALINTGGSLGFLYNDFNFSRSRIQLATIAGDGKVSINALYAGDAADWIPRSAKQVASREVIVPCFRKKQICFAKIVF
ncbi:MAG: hypothetical protein JST82_15360 [Bacteroidetes bacterium]|nr:hypothetical protein [Bacteroidota bacterium]